MNENSHYPNRSDWIPAFAGMTEWYWTTMKTNISLQNITLTIIEYYKTLSLKNSIIDNFLKSRHPGESRSPEPIGKTGFRLGRHPGPRSGTE